MASVFVWILMCASQQSGSQTPEALAGRFLEGEEAAGERLRAMGPGVLSLLRLRRAEPRVRTLIRQIRESAASAEDRKMADRLAGLKPRLDGSRPFGECVDTLMGDGVRYAIDPREFDVIWSCEVTPAKEGTALDVLEDACAQAGVDFAFLYGIVLVARPDRLWPALPLRAEPLSREEETRAKALVGRLGSEMPDEREQAAEVLRRFGTAVLPLLEAGAADADAEVAGRCRGLAAELRPKPARVFGPSSVERQSLAGADLSLFTGLRGKFTTYKVKDLIVRHNLSLLLSQVERSQVVGTLPEVKLTFSFENVPFTAILSVLTQSTGLDYLVDDGRLIVGPREEIEARLRR